MGGRRSRWRRIVRLMVLKAALSVGVPDAGGGGVGLDSSAPVLPDRVVGAGAGRVDGAQADPADRRGDGERADARVDRRGDAREAVPGAGGADRLDGDRGRREVSDRRGAGGARGAGARPGGPQARGAGRASSKRRVRDRSRAMGRTLRAITRTIRRRSGEAKAEVLRVDRADGQAAGALDRGDQTAGGDRAPARRAAGARRRSSRRPRSSRSSRTAARRSPGRSSSGSRASRSRTGSCRLADPDARPIRKGKLGKPNEFGYVTQLAEVTEHTRRGARGLILPAATAIGQPGREHAAAPAPSPSSKRLGISPREVALDGGFHVGPTSAGARRPRARAGVHLRPPTTRLQTHPAPAAALPNRRRRPDQPPQTPLRHWTAAASKATKASRSGPAGRSSPTTLDTLAIRTR